jgi:hypothetical protein
MKMRSSKIAKERTSVTSAPSDDNTVNVNPITAAANKKPIDDIKVAASTAASSIPINSFLADYDEDDDDNDNNTNMIPGFRQGNDDNDDDDEGGSSGVFGTVPFSNPVAAVAVPPPPPPKQTMTTPHEHDNGATSSTNPLAGVGSGGVIANKPGRRASLLGPPPAIPPPPVPSVAAPSYHPPVSTESLLFQSLGSSNSGGYDGSSGYSGNNGNGLFSQQSSATSQLFQFQDESATGAFVPKRRASLLQPQQPPPSSHHQPPSYQPSPYTSFQHQDQSEEEPIVNLIPLRTQLHRNEDNQNHWNPSSASSTSSQPLTQTLTEYLETPLELKNSQSLNEIFTKPTEEFLLSTNTILSQCENKIKSLLLENSNLIPFLSKSKSIQQENKKSSFSIEKIENYLKSSTIFTNNNNGMSGTPSQQQQQSYQQLLQEKEIILNLLQFMKISEENMIATIQQYEIESLTTIQKEGNFYKNELLLIENEIKQLNYENYSEINKKMKIFEKSKEILFEKSNEMKQQYYENVMELTKIANELKQSQDSMNSDRKKMLKQRYQLDVLLQDINDIHHSHSHGMMGSSGGSGYHTGGLVGNNGFQGSFPHSGGMMMMDSSSSSSPYSMGNGSGNIRMTPNMMMMRGGNGGNGGNPNNMSMNDIQQHMMNQQQGTTSTSFNPQYPLPSSDPHTMMMMNTSGFFPTTSSIDSPYGSNISHSMRSPGGGGGGGGGGRVPAARSPSPNGIRMNNMNSLSTDGIPQAPSSQQQRPMSPHSLSNIFPSTAVGGHLHENDSTNAMMMAMNHSGYVDEEDLFHQQQHQQQLYQQQQHQQQSQQQHDRTGRSRVIQANNINNRSRSPAGNSSQNTVVFHPSTMLARSGSSSAMNGSGGGLTKQQLFQHQMMQQQQQAAVEQLQQQQSMIRGRSMSPSAYYSSSAAVIPQQQRQQQQQQPTSAFHHMNNIQVNLEQLKKHTAMNKKPFK